MANVVLLVCVCILAFCRPGLVASVPGHYWQHKKVFLFEGDILVRKADKHIIASCKAEGGKWTGVLLDVNPEYSAEYETLAKCKSDVEKIVAKVK
jgi:hypothetical protein